MVSAWLVSVFGRVSLRVSHTNKATAATQWLFNFVITKITPEAVNHIGWRTFLMFGIFCIANGTFVFFFIKETKGRTLEDMDVLFGTIDAQRRQEDVERVLANEKSIMHHDEGTT